MQQSAFPFTWFRSSGLADKLWYFKLQGIRRDYFSPVAMSLLKPIYLGFQSQNIFWADAKYAAF